MSQDFDVVCDRCMEWHHFGQYMAAKMSMGYGTGDTEKMQATLEFIEKHAYDKGCGGVRVITSERVPLDYEDVEERRK